MRILAIDPGPTQSAFTLWDGVKQASRKVDNPEVIDLIWESTPVIDLLVIEMVASYGMAVGKEVFETCVWIGRFYEAFEIANYGNWVETSHEAEAKLIYRKDVKLHHCHNNSAKDSNIRQALIDRFGAPGIKKNPGITYGLASDTWQSFALAVYAFDKFTQEPQPEKAQIPTNLVPGSSITPIEKPLVSPDGFKGQNNTANETTEKNGFSEGLISPAYTGQIAGGVA